MEPLAPCVLWGSPPTLPNVHLVEVMPECGVLATASDAGVVLWKLPQGSEGEAATGTAQHELEMRPYALLFPPNLRSRQDRAIGGGGAVGTSGAGTTSSSDVVTALAGCAASPNEPTCIATAAASGAICVWQVSTGRCLRSSPDVVDFAATCMQTLPDRRYVLCAGQACDLALVDLQQMAVAHRLQGHQNWVERVTVQRATLEAGVPGVSMSAFAVSVCRDGALRFWDLEHERVRAASGMDGPSAGRYKAIVERCWWLLPAARDCFLVIRPTPAICTALGRSRCPVLLPLRVAQSCAEAKSHGGSHCGQTTDLLQSTYHPLSCLSQT
jgi:hypothetical protein